VQDSPPYDPAKPLDRAHEDRVAGHYAKAGVKSQPDEKAAESRTR